MGALACGCHPNCGIGTVLFVNKRTHEALPLCDFLDVEGLLGDLGEIADAAQPRAVTLAEIGLALLRRFDARRAPPCFGFPQLVRQLLSQTGARGEAVGTHESDARVGWRHVVEKMHRTASGAACRFR
jgi:uncharacterized radical SAM superfamily Fe-S cluster-containing enzyme